MVRIGEIWCCGDTDGNGLKTGLTVLSHLFPFLFPETSRIFPDCGVLKETVSGPFLLPVSLPGTFPDCGLLHFYKKRTIMDPVSGAKEKPIISVRAYVGISKWV